MYITVLKNNKLLVIFKNKKAKKLFQVTMVYQQRMSGKPCSCRICYLPTECLSILDLLSMLLFCFIWKPGRQGILNILETD